MRRFPALTALALAALCSAGCRALLPFGAPPRPGPSWRAVDAMWAAIRNDRERRSRFLSERYYVGHTDSGSAPLPSRAYHRVRVALGTRDRQPVIVVNTQQVLPFQHELNKQAPYYHGAILEEQELLFDRRWRLLKRSDWSWGVSPANDPAAKPADRLRYGMYGSGAGHFETRIEGRKAIVLEDGKVTRKVPFRGDLPSYEAIELLLGTAADAVKGATIQCQFVPCDRSDTYTVSEGEVQIDGPGGSPVATIAVKKARFGETEYIAPWRDERASSHGQSGTSLKPATAADYRRALATFVRDFKIRTLVDRDGNPVHLPMGLKGLRPSQRSHPCPRGGRSRSGASPMGLPPTSPQPAWGPPASPPPSWHRAAAPAAPKPAAAPRTLLGLPGHRELGP